MIAQMDCQKYREHLDEWIDGELDAELALAMEAHMQSCPDCAEETMRARETIEFIRSLEADVPVPLETQSAWRKAVRAEAKQRKTRKLTTVMRAISSAAAAFVLLAGCTAFFRSNGMLNPALPTAKVMEETTAADSGDAPAAPRMSSRKMGDPSRAVPMAYVASDGEADEAADVGTPAVASDMAAPVPAAAEEQLLIRSVERTIITDNYDGASQNIRDLTEQYGGYLADDATTTAENGLRVGQFTAVIPALEADSFLHTIDLVGNVTYTADHYEDATADLLDVQSRLDVLEAEKARLSELISEATSADELAQLSALMQATLAEIDALQAESNRINSELDNVRISIRLEELYPSVTASPTAEPALKQRMSSAFSQSAANLNSFVHDMAVSLMIIAPFLLAALGVVAVILAVVLIVRRCRKSGQ